MILHSEIPIDSIEQDGVMDILYSRKSWYNHHHYFRKYMRTHYLENEEMYKIVKKSARDYFPQIQECLNRYHDIVFLDVTDLTEEEKYTSGMLFLPSTITNNQFKTLETNVDYFKQFRSLTIEGGCEIKNLYESEEMDIEDDIEGSAFPIYLEEIIQGLIKGKHK